jgi:hypothetical protein
MTDKSTQPRVLIFDTTLRDGEQSPGATMTHDEKLEIAGFWTRWASTSSRRAFPSPRKATSARCRTCAKRAKNSTICGLARANQKDIDRCWEAVRHAKSPRIHTFIGTSPLHRAIPNLTWTRWPSASTTPSPMRATCATTCSGRRWMPRGRNMTICAAWWKSRSRRGHHDQHPRHGGLYLSARKRRHHPHAAGSRAGCRYHRLRHALPQRSGHGHGQRAGGGRGGRAADRMHDQRSGRTRGQYRAGRGGDGPARAQRHPALPHRHRHHPHHEPVAPRQRRVGLSGAVQQGHRGQERLPARIAASIRTAC